MSSPTPSRMGSPSRPRPNSLRIGQSSDRRRRSSPEDDGFEVLTAPLTPAREASAAEAARSLNGAKTLTRRQRQWKRCHEITDGVIATVLLLTIIVSAAVLYSMSRAQADERPGVIPRPGSGTLVEDERPEVGAEIRPANGTKGNTTAVAIYNATEAATEATAEVVQAAVQPLTEALQAVASIANSALEAVGRRLHDIVFEDRE